jgi:hypothetical protein
VGGNGAAGGQGGDGLGGGGFNAATGVLTITPRKGAPRRSPQSRATNLIMNNRASAGPGGAGGTGGSAQAGSGGISTAPGFPIGAPGTATPGNPGAPGLSGVGVGGGLDLFSGGTATINNTTVAGNQATTSDNDVAGTVTT